MNEIYNVVTVRMNLLGKYIDNVDKSGNIHIKWFDGEDRVFETNDEFVFLVHGMNEAINKATVIYNLNRKYISKISFSENKAYEN